MGSTNYYLKARFASVEAAATALPLVEDFIRQCQEAEIWTDENQGQDMPTMLAGKFPLAHAFCDFYGGNVNDSHFGFGTDEMPFLDEADKAVILFTAEVWHMLSWERFCDYLVKHFGAVTAKYISDEEANYFDCVQV
jgi:hypothetical protein